MSDSNRKKELKELYKQRRMAGGVYRIRNRETGRYYLQATDDMNATCNQFEFAVKLNNCTLPPIQADWKRFGASAFELEELDTIEQGEDQSYEDYQRDVKTLFELWDEKLRGEDRY